MQPIYKLSILASALFTFAVACAALTPGEKNTIKEGFALACPLEAMIPLVGFEFAAACPTQEKDVADALDGNPASGVSVVTNVPDAGPVVLASVHKLTATGALCIGHGRMRARRPPNAVVAAMPYVPDASMPDAR